MVFNRVDFPAPGIELTDLVGNPVALADYRGQVVLLNNWATWCPPCVQELTVLDRLYKTYRDKGLVVVALSDEPRERLQKFFAQRPAEFREVLG